MDDRLPPVSCHSVEVAVGCQDIIQSSIGIQCSMEDEVSAVYTANLSNKYING